MVKPIQLRLRLYLMIVPLVVTVAGVSSVFATLESTAALTRTANQHLAFKAELLRNYFFSEWEVVTQLKLDAQDIYRKEVEKSFLSYARSLLRRDTEVIYIVNSSGAYLKHLSLDTRSSLLPPGTRTESVNHWQTGWIAGEMFGNNRVGVAFNIEPLGWKVLVTELESTFFSEIKNIQTFFLILLLIATLLVTLILTVFLNYILRPLERLTTTVTGISLTGDLSQRTLVESSDEIGILAVEFNQMLTTLEGNYHRIEAANQATKLAMQAATDSEEETLTILGRVSDFRDEETGSHLKRIGKMSALFSKLLNQSEEEQKMILYSAPLHDIGKIGIPDKILCKPDSLSDQEYEVMKQHTEIGYQLLKEAKGKYLLEGAEIARSHHEKWDGTGYPQGLAGESIPLTARIVGLADVLDALTSQRRYKPSWPPEQTLRYILEQKGKHFDPALVDLLQENFGLFCELLYPQEDVPLGS